MRDKSNATRRFLVAETSFFISPPWSFPWQHAPGPVKAEYAALPKPNHRKTREKHRQSCDPTGDD
jgi:hypothetical protein